MGRYPYILDLPSKPLANADYIWYTHFTTEKTHCSPPLSRMNNNSSILNSVSSNEKLNCVTKSPYLRPRSPEESRLEL